MKVFDPLIKTLASHKGEFEIKDGSMRHSWIKCSALTKLNVCPLAFLTQKEGEFANNDDFEKFSDVLGLSKDEVADFVTAADIPLKFIQSEALKNLRRTLLYELRLKEEENPSQKAIAWIEEYRRTKSSC
jgi:hypothetical protein